MGMEEKCSNASKEEAQLMPKRGRKPIPKNVGSKPKPAPTLFANKNGTPDQLDVKTLEGWLWEAACSIRGAVDSGRRVAHNHVWEHDYENRGSYLQCRFLGILLHGHVDRWASKGRRYSFVVHTFFDADTQRGGDSCPIFPQPRRETRGIGQQYRMAWACLLANHG
jgi:hypothetical protein